MSAGFAGYFFVLSSFRFFNEIDAFIRLVLIDRINVSLRALFQHGAQHLTEKKNKKRRKKKTISKQDKMTDSNLKEVKATNKDAYLK